MGEVDLPVPAQLETQLAKCKTVRKAAEYYKSREKSSAVSSVNFNIKAVQQSATNLTCKHIFPGNGGLQSETSAATCCIKMK
jgi:hypothetical protein